MNACERCARTLMAEDFAGRIYCATCGDYADGIGNRYGGRFSE